MLDDGSELPYDLFLGVPKHRAPESCSTSGLAEDGYIPVDSATLATRFPASTRSATSRPSGTPKAGVFAEGAARVLAATLIGELRGGGDPGAHGGTGSCYIEFGADRIGRVDIDFLSSPEPTGTFRAPSAALRVDKEVFGSSRRARWFGRSG